MAHKDTHHRKHKPKRVTTICGKETTQDFIPYENNLFVFFYIIFAVCHRIRWY